jgi:predicted membrane metal-binding protein
MYYRGLPFLLGGSGDRRSGSGNGSTDNLDQRERENREPELDTTQQRSEIAQLALGQAVRNISEFDLELLYAVRGTIEFTVHLLYVFTYSYREYNEYFSKILGSV